MRPQQRFNVVVCLLSPLPQSMAFVRSWVIFMGALILNLCLCCSTLTQYDECSPLWFASAFYRRDSLPTFRAYQQTMAFPNHAEVFHRLVSTSPYAIGNNMDAFRLISLRFSRGITSFLVVAVGLSLLLGIHPFCCWTILVSWRTSSHD